MGIADLAIVLNEIFLCCTKWFNIGAQLGVGVGILDSVKVQYFDQQYGDQLREVLKVWLKTSENPTWGVIVKTVKTHAKKASLLQGSIKQVARLCIVVVTTLFPGCGKDVTTVQLTRFQG